MTKSHNKTLAILRTRSIQENLRLVYPDGRTRRAYYTDIDRTRARGEYTMNGIRLHVYGKIDGDLLVVDQPMLTIFRLKEVLSYNPQNGVFLWIKKPSRYATAVHIGERAGNLDNHGYRRIKIDGEIYSEHRLAWLYIHEVWPNNEIDHINRIRDDNRLSNLREASRSENATNALYPNNSTNVSRSLPRWRYI